LETSQGKIEPEVSHDNALRTNLNNLYKQQKPKEKGKKEPVTDESYPKTTTGKIHKHEQTRQELLPVLQDKTLVTVLVEIGQTAHDGLSLTNGFWEEEGKLGRVFVNRDNMELLFGQKFSMLFKSGQ